MYVILIRRPGEGHGAEVNRRRKGDTRRSHKFANLNGSDLFFAKSRKY